MPSIENRASTRLWELIAANHDATEVTEVFVVWSKNPSYPITQFGIAGPVRSMASDSRLSPEAIDSLSRNTTCSSDFALGPKEKNGREERQGNRDRARLEMPVPHSELTLFR